MVNLELEVKFWLSVSQHRISTEMCKELIEKKSFFKLRRVFRVRFLPDDLWRKLLENGDAKTVKCYLRHYDFASQVRDVLKLPEERIKKLSLEAWMDVKLRTSGLSKEDYLFLLEKASFRLQAGMLFLRKSVAQLNHYLETFFAPPLIHCPADLWADMKNFSTIMLEKEMLLLCPEEVIVLMNKMLLDEDEVDELIKLGSEHLIDAWLASNRIRDKVVNLLDRRGYAFEVKPYLSEKQRQLLLQKGWNLKAYQL